MRLLRLTVASAACGVALALAASARAAQADRTDRTDRAEVRAAALVARMTLDEKIAQLINVAPAIERLGVPAYNWWTESLHGAIGPVPTTNFPEPIGLAATFDAPLVREVARAIGREVRALHTLGRETGRGGAGLNTWAPTSTSSATLDGAAARRPTARIRT